MKVGNRLTLFCSIIFGIVFATTSLLIYFLHYSDTEKNIYKGLEKNAYMSAFFYLEEDELNAAEFAKVRKQFNDLVASDSYQIYGDNDLVNYGRESLEFPVTILDEIREKGSLSFAFEDYLCYGIFYEDNQGDFVVITKEYKTILGEQMNSLFNILLSAFIIGLLAIVILSKWIAYVAYRPFRSIIKQVNNISTNNLDIQIQSPNTKDELQDLIETFNSLLSKISDTFIIQKNFVNYVSHEFKTPLASVLGNLEVFSLKDRSAEEYQDLSNILIADIHQLEDILEAMMVVSDLREEADSYSNSRIDELIWEIVGKLREKYSEMKFEVDIKILPEDERLLYIQLDRTQLYMALLNLIDNAVKYSNKLVDIQLYNQQDKLCLAITDKGRGIPTNQLQDISKPFFRAHNTERVEGFGIGLSIALRILENNGIEYLIDSKEGEGTTVILIF